jgi:hypothetical protein
LRLVELENVLCNQDKLLYKVFRENKKLNLELKNASSEIAFFLSAHDDMSVKSCDSCTMIMVNYTNLWFIHSHVASLLECARLELRELKAHSTLLGACTSCPLLRSDLEAAAVEIKDLKHKLNHSSRYTILSPPYEACISLKGKLFHATKENTQLHQEVAYLTVHLEKTISSEKMIEEDLSRVEKSVTKSTYRLGVGFERSEDKGEKSALKFIPSSSYHKEEKTSNPSKLTTHPIQSHPLTQREEAFVCMFYGCAGHLDEFCFRHKRIESRRVEYARDSYRDEFIDFLPRSYSHVLPRFYSCASPRTFSCALPHTSSCALPQFAYGPNHLS